MLFHPFPVFLVQFGPLRPKLDTPVTRFHCSDPSDGRGVALDGCLHAPPTSAVPPPTPRSKPFPLRITSAQAPRRHLVARHERHQADQYSRDFPRGVEGFGVEVGNRKAEAG